MELPRKQLLSHLTCVSSATPSDKPSKKRAVLQKWEARKTSRKGELVTWRRVETTPRRSEDGGSARGEDERESGPAHGWKVGCE